MKKNCVVGMKEQKAGQTIPDSGMDKFGLANKE